MMTALDAGVGLFARVQTGIGNGQQYMQALWHAIFP